MNAPDPQALAPVTLTPLGAIESPFLSVETRCDYRSESRLVLRPELTAALAGIEYFSHLWVIYRQHRTDDWLRVHGWGTPAAPLVVPTEDERAGQGILSTRAPCRPAGLGSCIVALVRREENVLVVRGLDALHGTPLIDVKPYVPQFDAFPDAVVPRHWARVMDRADDAAQLARELHWDTSNVDFALGLRVGVAALQRLGVARGASLRAELVGSGFFAHGFEMATGCSPLRGTLVHTPRTVAEAPWTVRLTHGDTTLDYRLDKLVWPDAASVLSATDGELGFAGTKGAPGT
ncbi:MAG: SAM-dependent methyltransferase [Opitutaceae bacterium]|jgi:tRNA-Thr(GGU) m(6)t(6)A37 methyltransferase TsaA|nr:SAM-dependent methyltransferase [Opitutaceae bacterium]MBP8961773.1 SAM-dependent methyltransferase [Opitutaceae bacterium]